MKNIKLHHIIDLGVEIAATLFDAFVGPIILLMDHGNVIKFTLEVVADHI